MEPIYLDVETSKRLQELGLHRKAGKTWCFIKERGKYFLLTSRQVLREELRFVIKEKVPAIELLTDILTDAENAKKLFGDEVRRRIPCPDGKEGCSVNHYVTDGGYIVESIRILRALLRENVDEAIELVQQAIKKQDADK